MSRYDGAPDRTHEYPTDGESDREARDRRQRNRERRQAWERWANARCSFCGHVRLHVSHEDDPETSLEGPEYHADFSHHLFVDSVR